MLVSCRWVMNLYYLVSGWLVSLALILFLFPLRRLLRSKFLRLNLIVNVVVALQMIGRGRSFLPRLKIYIMNCYELIMFMYWRILFHIPFLVYFDIIFILHLLWIKLRFETVLSWLILFPNYHLCADAILMKSIFSQCHPLL